ncbi:hypothetical protein, partial [Staphylococcus aureus]|uniref:hypothetical protein n=1 Tax=Staphylococcus aureus TaxID=1280 RepID=UPI001C930804
MTIKISSMPSFATKFGHQKRALLNEHSLNYLSVIFVLSTVSISGSIINRTDGKVFYFSSVRFFDFEYKKS